MFSAWNRLLHKKELFANLASTSEILEQTKLGNELGQLSINTSPGRGIDNVADMEA